MTGVILAVSGASFDGFEGMTIFVVLAAKFGLKMRAESIFPLDGCRASTKKGRFRPFPSADVGRIKMKYRFPAPGLT